MHEWLSGPIKADENNTNCPKKTVFSLTYLFLKHLLSGLISLQTHHFDQWPFKSVTLHIEEKNTIIAVLTQKRKKRPKYLEIVDGFLQPSGPVWGPALCLVLSIHFYSFLYIMCLYFTNTSGFDSKKKAADKWTLSQHIKICVFQRDKHFMYNLSLSVCRTVNTRFTTK